SEPERKKTSRFIQHCLLGTAEQVITEALTIAVLREDACKRLPEFSIDALSRLLAQSQRPEYIEEAIGCWGNAESYEDAKIRTKKLIIPLIPVLQGPQIVQMVALFQNNNQLSDSFFTRDIILDLFRHSSQYAEDTKHAWVQLYEQFCEVRQGKLIQQKIPSLLSLIEDTYPNDIDPIRAQIREQYVQQRYEDGTQDEFFDTF
ncbi:MAG TPA: hypothetical protein VKX46_12060, partial [Ktedonobacteraceae bacterium]|nr:hypothetical protein [Ktedonobacteraceae bacterium]